MGNHRDLSLDNLNSLPLLNSLDNLSSLVFLKLFLNRLDNLNSQLFLNSLDSLSSVVFLNSKDSLNSPLFLSLKLSLNSFLPSSQDNLSLSVSSNLNQSELNLLHRLLQLRLSQTTALPMSMILQEMPQSAGLSSSSRGKQQRPLKEDEM